MTSVEERPALIWPDFEFVCAVGRDCATTRPECDQPARWLVTGHECTQPDAVAGYVTRPFCDEHTRAARKLIASGDAVQCRHCHRTFATARHWFTRIEPL